MFKEKIKEIGKGEKNNKKKIENIVFLIIVLIVTIVIINTIMGDSNKTSNKEKEKAMYDETTTTSTTEETDSSGGVRNVTSTETQKEVIYSEQDGDKKPMTEKVIMPSIEGAIITAEGASNASVKTNIVNAVQAATGLTIDKIQVFEKNKK